MMKDASDVSPVLVKSDSLYSDSLKRDVLIDIYLPATTTDYRNLSLLLINDGQDLPVMPFTGILSDLYHNNAIQPIVCIGIHCGTDRKNEYGTARQLHYEGLGAKAGLYTHFVMDELLPYVSRKHNLHSFKDKSFAGFSLGGLSALDIVFQHPQAFVSAGIFSGSLWWRSRSYGKGYNDDVHRIMHAQVRNAPHYPWLRFFFECGALDELADRNNNGVIDSVDDTRDLVAILKEKGYATDAIQYLELADGMHNVATWARAFPRYLTWQWGK